MDKRLEQIVRETFSIKSNEVIEKSWTSDDIPKWDSLGHLNMIMAIEREFNIKFEIEEMFQIQCLDDISNILQKKVENYS